jgi:putative flippase GtrA
MSMRMTPPMIATQVRILWQDNRAEINRFAKFLVVGTLGATIDFSLLNAGIQLLGLAKWLANTFSFFAAVLSNFTWNRLWTYPETRSDPVIPQLSQFLLVNIAGYLINQAIFLSLDRYVFQSWGILGYNLAKACAIGVVLFWNFGVNRVWTYRKVK